MNATKTKHQHRFIIGSDEVGVCACGEIRDYKPLIEKYERKFGAAFYLPRDKEREGGLRWRLKG